MNAFKDFQEFIVEEAYPTVYYIPEFISEENEKSLIEKIYSAPIPKWTQLSGRRLQNWGGLPHPKGMIQERMPEWLTQYTDKVTALGVFDGNAANHVLVNEYKPGQGIMPHLDGPLFYPTITTISLGSQILLDFYRQLDTPLACQDLDTKHESSFESRYVRSILLQPRSLVVFTEDMYKVYLHGIKESKADIFTNSVINPDRSKNHSIGDVLTRGTRISLTIRHVPKVLKVKLGLRK